MIDIMQQHRQGLLHLCRKYAVARLYIIGSALRSDCDPGRSDIDFLLEFNDFTTDNAADKSFGLMIDLEYLFQQRIDLVSFRAIRNPYFKQVVDQTRVSRYSAG